MEMTKLLGRFIIPFSYYIKRDLRYKYFKEYMQHLQLSRKEIIAMREKKIQKLVRHAYETVPYYMELMDSHGIKPDDIRTADDLKKLPILTKSIIMKNEKRLISKKKYKLIKHFTGGSTGNKATFWKDKRYHELSYGAMMRGLQMAGINPGYKSAWIWGDTHKNLTLMNRINDTLAMKINRRIMFNVFKYTDQDVIDWLLNDFNKFRPDYIYGYAGTLYDMAKIIKKHNLKICQIKKIITSCERLEHREFLENVFKCKVIDQYGSTEVTIIGIEDDNNVMHYFDDFVIVEVEDDEILLTPLESYGMPLLRYQLGDIGFISKELKDTNSGWPFSQFNLSVGRIYEALYNKEGIKVSGGLIKQEAEDEDLDINEFQVVQKSLDEVDLNIVKDEFTTYESAKKLKKIIMHTLECSKVKIKYLDKFPAEANGKKIAFKCMIQK